VLRLADDADHCDPEAGRASAFPKALADRRFARKETSRPGAIDHYRQDGVLLNLAPCVALVEQTPFDQREAERGHVFRRHPHPPRGGLRLAGRRRLLLEIEVVQMVDAVGRQSPRGRGADDARRRPSSPSAPSAVRRPPVRRSREGPEPGRRSTCSRSPARPSARPSVRQFESPGFAESTWRPGPAAVAYRPTPRPRRVSRTGGEQDALRQQVAQHASARGAERRADGKFLTAARDARDQQVRRTMWGRNG
jgi:hypothetical protein